MISFGRGYVSFDRAGAYSLNFCEEGCPCCVTTKWTQEQLATGVMVKEKRRGHRVPKGSENFFVITVSPSWRLAQTCMHMRWFLLFSCVNTRWWRVDQYLPKKCLVTSLILFYARLHARLLWGFDMYIFNSWSSNLVLCKVYKQAHRSTNLHNLVLYTHQAVLMFIKFQLIMLPWLHLLFNQLSPHLSIDRGIPIKTQVTEYTLFVGNSLINYLILPFGHKACGRYLIQALPPMVTLRCLTGKQIKTTKLSTLPLNTSLSTTMFVQHVKYNTMMCRAFSSFGHYALKLKPH